MTNKKKLNLQFGAEIKELVVEPQAQQFKSTDGIDYSYDQYKTNPTIVKLMTKGFQYTQSPNSNLKAKKKTNGGIHTSINKFLKWIEEINYTGELDRNLLLNYQNFLKQDCSSWSTYSYYTVIARICVVLMEKQLLPVFIVPKNIPLQQAKNASKAGQTIASVVNFSSNNLSADDINEKVLSIIVNAVWEQTFVFFDILEKGNRIIQNNDNKFIHYDKSMTREQALFGIIKNMYIEFKGLSNQYTFSTRFKGYENQIFIELMNKYVTANINNRWHICGEEITSYLYPTKNLVNCILILLSASQVNPESAAYLDIDCLQSDINEDVSRLSWIKHRAGGVQKSIPFPNGKSDKSKTIPNVIRLFKKHSSLLRKEAQNDLQSKLLIWKGYQVGRIDKIQSCTSFGNSEIKVLLNIIKNNLIEKNIDSPEYQIAIKSCTELTLSLIRTTAINISSKRLNRDITNVAIMDGRKSETALVEHYLNNASTKESFDQQIRESQNLMYEWVNLKPIIIPEDEKQIIAQLNVSKEVAHELINDEFNNGYGASLVNHNVIIIDSPLNALRMIQWIQKLEANENKMLIINPDRWNNLYLPQKKLFNDALSLMSKKSKSEAFKMNKEITLPFPEVL